MTEQQAQTAGGWLDNFVEYVKQAIDIIQLKTDAIDRARDDEEAFTMGLVIIALAGVGAAIGSLNPFGVIFMPVFFLVGAFIGIAILHLIATLLFGGEGEYVRVFRPLSLAYILAWVNVVWILNVILSPLAGLWMCVVAVVCIEREYGLDRPKAIATVAIPVVVLLFLMMMFFAFLGAAAIMLAR
ncbi:MAG: YIP1 family protein [Acidobacteriota bacterium]|jgi:hypothetical protein